MAAILSWPQCVKLLSCNSSASDTPKWHLFHAKPFMYWTLCSKSLLFLQIFTLMRQDSYPRFLKSDLYKQCVVAEMEGKALPFGPPQEKKEDKKVLKYLIYSRQINGLVHDCSIFIANAMEILQSCTEPSKQGAAFSTILYMQICFQETWICISILYHWLTFK